MDLLMEQENCVMMHDLNNKIKEQKDLIVQLIEKDVSINDIIERDRERCGYFKQLGQLHLYTPAAEM